MPNEYGKDVFADYLRKLGAAAKVRHDCKVKFAYLMKAITLMQHVEFSRLPTNTSQFFATLEIEVEGETYEESFELIKPLAAEDIYELRINIEKYNWRLRATFFPQNFNDKDFYCFVFPFEKAAGRKDLTNHFRDKTFSIRHDLRENPEKYVEYFEE